MELPRVTEILKEAGLIDTTWMTEHGRERGTAVHLACQYYDEGTLDYGSITPEIEGYLRAYDAWKQAAGVEGFEWIECPQQDPRGLYRGTPDRILSTRPRVIWDLKSGGYLPCVSLQLAAYVNMMKDPWSYDRNALYLSSDGTYTVKQFPKSEYQTDLNVFLSALNVVTWKRGKNGRRNETT